MIKTTEKLSFKNIIQYPSICIEKNTFIFITGKSGCGKSTYLKFLNRTLIADEQTIFYKNRPASNYPILEYRKQVLLVPQNGYLLDASILENFNFYYDAREENRLSDEQIKQYLAICCINAELNKNCNTMSGGERQRVFLAIFLSLAREVLLLDEPTSALDEKTSIQLMQNLKSYCKEKQYTVVCVCHNLSLVNKFADKHIILGRACTWSK